MARVLGLDLGSHSIKGVVLETTLRGHATRGYFEVPLGTEGERLERLKAALPAALTQLGTPVDTIAISMPGVALATHPLTLPFNDPKKIESTIAFEVESQIPYELSDAIYDFQPATADDKGSSLIVGVLKKTELTPLLEVLKEAKFDPKIVTHPGLAYQSVFSVLPAEPENAPVAVLDLGHERTCVSIGRPSHSIEMTRTFPGGGLALSKALAKEFNIGLTEAQAWKEQHGAIGEAAVGPDAERAAGVLIRALQPTIRELRTTLKNWATRSKDPIRQILLTGGTCLLTGLPEMLERELGVPCRRLELEDEVRAVTGASSARVAQSWALAIRAQASGQKAPRFNLRRGDFAFKSDFDFMREKVGQLVGFAAVLLVLLIASGLVRNTVLERRQKMVEAALCDTTQRILGKCETDFSRALSMLRGKESPTAGIPKRSAASLLAEVTQRVPAELPVTVDQMVIDIDRISLRCEAKTSQNMEDLINSLKTYKCFKEIKEGKLEKNKDGTKVNFRLDIQVECPDDVVAAQG